MLWLPNLVITLNDGAAAVMILEASAVSFWVIKFVLTIVVVTIEVGLHSVLRFCHKCRVMTSFDIDATALECVVPYACLIDTVNLVS